MQRRVYELKKYQESFKASNSNNLSGLYKGYAVYYDFSGQYVSEVLPITVKMTRNGNTYDIDWREGDNSSAVLHALFSNNNLAFDSSSQYTRNNYYSYGSDERFLFSDAKLQLKYLQDSIYLSGDVRFYSLKRREPSQPVYISLSRAMVSDENGIGNLTLNLLPNPATSYVSVNFTLDKTSKISLQMFSVSGKLIQEIPARRLPAGTYKFDMNLQGLPQGNYIITARTSEGTNATISKQFVKL